ncbi:MAG: hypothetical protein ACOZF0_23160 [Thermodesulfobacteriota bacterium]
MEHPDHLETRCPRLGSLVAFRYCREHGGDGLPCWKLFDCWWEYFDVQSHVRNCYPQEVVDRMLAGKPQPKINSLIDLIQAAKKRTGQE